MKNIFTVVVALLTPFLLKAQNQDELKDSTASIQTIIQEKPSKSFFNKSAPYITPAAMFGYGLLANYNKGLQSINHEIREEVLERKRTISNIEDKLQYAPVHAVFALNIVGLKSENNFIDRLFLYGLSNTIMSQAVSKIKTASNKLRPDGNDRRSFPSGHTATAFSAAEFMRLEYKDKSPIYGIAAYTVAAATGALRIYHNKHWFSDVVAGAGVGILSTDLAYFVYPKVKKLVLKKTGFKSNNLHIGPTYQSGKAGVSLIYNPK